MKRLVLLISFAGGFLCGQDLSNIHSVYLMPMSRGLDQYLANRLTTEHVFKVVTNPKLADAIFTDRVGPAFEDKLTDLTKSTPPAGTDKQAEGSPPAAENPQPASANRPPAGSPVDETVNKLDDLTANSSFARSKGTLFLVNPKSHQVLWSVYRPSKDSSSGQMDRTASDIVSRLKRDLKPKQ